jgi:hypothetical protein
MTRSGVHPGGPRKATVNVSGGEARVRCQWCAASIPDANVWTIDAGIIALCPACGRFSEAADAGHLSDQGPDPRLEQRRKRRPRRPPDPPSRPEET